MQIQQFLSPETLFHGTLSNRLPSFREKLLNREYWVPDRDFGAGFYTTISLEQAKQWAISTYEETRGLKGQPSVLRIKLNQTQIDFQPFILYFGAESLNWASFIFSHRKNRDKDKDPCKPHPDIIMGPMADNRTSIIVRKAIKWNKGMHWFYDQITRDKEHQKLDSLQLGYQFVFSNEHLERLLRLEGHYMFTKGRWIYHEETDQSIPRV
ncbi:DUF3990 domain-containing protein [Paenibacillus alkalitolerans]|uniref:DUF3990 domain-containing protein n=1 Tax=Paenibacillus alkalitolerans TaxID=2799335 RepID=UPI0018F39A81|nr:DUF3990 domain-containing protein [Paenibacillus alkalitolerans]